MHVWPTHDEYLVVFITVQTGWNRCSSFDNMQVLIFNEFDLKRLPVFTRQIEVCLGEILPPKWGASHRDPNMACLCEEARLRTYRPFLHSSPFYPIPPKSYGLEWVRHYHKSAFPTDASAPHTWLLGPRDSASKTASRSVQPFSQGSRL